jgi:hypothetical protein
LAYTKKFPPPTKTTLDYYVRVENGVPVQIKEIVVHSFYVADVEDPVIHAAIPMTKWRDSDQGQWVLENSIESPTLHKTLDYVTYGYKFIITSKLKEADISFFMLKWGNLK